MPEPAENYTPVRVAERFRRQAWRVWAVGFAVVAVWVSLIVAAPVLRAYSIPNIAEPLYTFFGFLCHQIDARSLHIFHEPYAVCSRCFGVYLGLPLGFAAYPLWRRVENIDPLPRVWLFAAIVPVAIDWSLTIFGIWENTHLSRLITGAILGLACATYIIPALIEAIRLLTKPRRPHPVA